MVRRSLYGGTEKGGHIDGEELLPIITVTTWKLAQNRRWTGELTLNVILEAYGYLKQKACLLLFTVMIVTVAVLNWRQKNGLDATAWITQGLRPFYLKISHTDKKNLYVRRDKLPLSIQILVRFLKSIISEPIEYRSIPVSHIRNRCILMSIPDQRLATLRQTLGTSPFVLFAGVKSSIHFQIHQSPSNTERKLCKTIAWASCTPW